MTDYKHCDRCDRIIKNEEYHMVNMYLLKPHLSRYSDTPDETLDLCEPCYGEVVAFIRRRVGE